MPRITEATNSPNKIVVSNPNRSGKCVAPGGNAVVLRAGSHELPMSIKRATAQPAYRCGAGSTAELAQINAAEIRPAIRRLTKNRQAPNLRTLMYWQSEDRAHAAICSAESCGLFAA